MTDSRGSGSLKGSLVDTKRRVVLAPAKVFNNGTADIVTLRHPRSKRATLFMFADEDSAVFEVTSYVPDYSSWFVDDSVIEDGRLQIITPFDPLFLAIPYLTAASKAGRTLPLEDLFADDDFPESHRISHCKGLSQLTCIADKKGGEEINAWAYNEEKTLNWLKTKTERLVEALTNQNLTSANGAVSKTFVMSSKLKDVEDTIGCLNNACGFISEYLPDEIGKKLRQHLNLPEAKTLKRKSSADQLSSKRSKLDAPGQGLPSTGDKSKGLPKKTPAKGPTAREKNQMRAAAGSKTITSFFKKK